MDKMRLLIGRLWKACQRFDDYGGDLWGRGLQKIQDKYDCETWTSEFVPQEMVEGEQPKAEITITPIKK